jgi:microcystin-dependent protein
MKRKYLSLLFGILLTLFFAASSFAATSYKVLQFRSGTAAQWTAANPVMAQGEPGYESDTGKLKMGDGLTHWSSLSYYPPTFTNDWVVQSGTLTYMSGTQFKIAGNLTTTFLPTVRVRAVVTAGTIYGSVTTSTAGGSPVLTTVNVTWDSRALDAGLSEIAINILSFLNLSVLPNLMPAGVMMPYAGTAPPTGWLLCYGQAVLRTTYSGLYAAIGTTFGSGDGMTTFNLPDLRGRMTVGLDNMGGTAAGRVAAATSLAASGGYETINLAHTHTTGDHTLTVAEMPSHVHTLALQAAAGGDRNFSGTGITTSNTNTGSTGGDTAHNHGPTGSSLSATQASMNPYIVTSYIIKF